VHTPGPTPLWESWLSQDPLQTIFSDLKPNVLLPLEYRRKGHGLSGLEIPMSPCCVQSLPPGGPESIRISWWLSRYGVSRCGSASWSCGVGCCLQIPGTQKNNHTPAWARCSLASAKWDHQALEWLFKESLISLQRGTIPCNPPHIPVL
jgi:hypothetical protein